MQKKYIVPVLYKADDFDQMKGWDEDKIARFKQYLGDAVEKDDPFRPLVQRILSDFSHIDQGGDAKELGKDMVVSVQEETKEEEGKPQSLTTAVTTALPNIVDGEVVHATRTAVKDSTKVSFAGGFSLELSSPFALIGGLLKAVWGMSKNAVVYQNEHHYDKQALVNALKDDFKKVQENIDMLVNKDFCKAISNFEEVPIHFVNGKKEDAKFYSMACIQDCKKTLSVFEKQPEKLLKVIKMHLTMLYFRLVYSPVEESGDGLNTFKVSGTNLLKHLGKNKMIQDAVKKQLLGESGGFFTSASTTEQRAKLVQNIQDLCRWFSATSDGISPQHRMYFPCNGVVTEIPSGTCVQVLKGHTKDVYGVAVVSEDVVVSGSRDNTVRVWNWKTGKELQVLKGHTDAVRGVAKVSKDVLVSGSDDATVRVWNWKTGKELQVLKGHTDKVYGVAKVSEDVVVSGSNDNTVRVWSWKTGKELQVLKGHTGYVLSVAKVSEDMVVSGSDDATVRVWNWKTGKELQVMERGYCWKTKKQLGGHMDKVYGVAKVSEDVVVSGSKDETVRVWNWKTGKTLQVLKGHEGYVYGVAKVSENVVVSGSNDNTLRVWKVVSSKK